MNIHGLKNKTMKIREKIRKELKKSEPSYNKIGKYRAHIRRINKKIKERRNKWKEAL